MSRQRYIYKKELLSEESTSDIALFLFQARVESNLSLDEAAKKTGIAAEVIDAYEIAQEDIDFLEIAALLNMYNCRLSRGYRFIFPGLPEDYYDLYFEK